MASTEPLTGRRMAEARARWLADFRRRAGDGSGFHLEPALRTSDGAVALEGVLALPLRVDLIRRRDGASVWVQATGPASQGVERFAVQGIPVSVRSPRWEALTVRLASCVPTDLAPVRAWFFRWFDEEDVNPRTAEGLQGVVHFLSDPVTADGDTLLTVDLGSAPLAAFEELLRCLASLGPAAVDLGSLAVTPG